MKQEKILGEIMQYKREAFHTLIANHKQCKNNDYTRGYLHALDEVLELLEK